MTTARAHVGPFALPDGWSVTTGEALNPGRRSREGLSVVTGDGMPPKPTYEQARANLAAEVGRLLASYEEYRKARRIGEWCRRAEAAGAESSAPEDTLRAPELRADLRRLQTELKPARTRR